MFGKQKRYEVRSVYELRSRLDSLIISFLEKDETSFLRNDSWVISVIVDACDVGSILRDTDNSVDLLFLSIV